MFSRRIVDLTFMLGEGDFGEAGLDTVTLSGLRCSANITKAGGASMSMLDLRVWGMSLEQMNKLTVLNKLAYPQQRFNVVTVSAGDEDAGTSVVFRGTIQEAWADGRNPPDMMFHVSAFSGLFESIKAVPPTSYKGSVDAATVFAGIALQMGFSLENSGVTGTVLNDPYLPGALGDQLRSVARAAHVSYLIEPAEGILAIWPKGGSRNGQIIEVSSATGMVGYPSFTQNGIQITTLYNPSLVFGRNIRVASAFGSANGTWTIANVSHNLDSDLPGGEWFSEIECTLLGQEVGIHG